MSTLPVVLSPEASDDVLLGFAWYEGVEPGLGDRFVAEVGRVVERVGVFPSAHPRLDEAPRYRRAPVAGFPWVLFYEVRRDSVEVVAVSHVKRLPGWWLAR